MSLYETGTITGALNSTTISGTGTKWSDAKIGITNGSVLFVSSSAGMDGVYQAKRVINDTSIELTQPIYKAFTNAKYSILVSEASSTASFANQLAAALGYYQAQIDGWQQIMTGTGDIVLTAPDGTKVTIKSFTKMSQDIDKKQDKSKILTDISNSKDADGVREYLGLNEILNEKASSGDNSDITSISGLKTALSIAQGGTGASNASDARKNIGLSKVAGWVTETWDLVPQSEFDFRTIVSHAVPDVYPKGITAGIQAGSAVGASSNFVSAINVRGWTGTSAPQASAQWYAGLGSAGVGVRIPKRYGSTDDFYYENVFFYTKDNTTKTSDGTLKAASPVINIYGNGSFTTNDESEGAQVERVSIGVYRITHVLGMNSDGAWGGIDGGFDVPKDRNGQRLLWLDYEVEADGSILVKTYHRTYPDAPAFARNIKDGYEEGDPIDIPSDQFVSVRVEMPQDSIWNLAQKAAQEEMGQEQSAEE